MNLILLGPPGAGKGTQGALLAERRGLARIATGDLLRDAVAKGTPLGEAAKGYMDAGELVPDEVVLGLVREILADEEATPGGFLLDGFPRTIQQAEGLDGILAELDRPLDAVVVIEVADDVLVRRISGRRACPKCGAVYNIYSDPPRSPGVCDRCGGALAERADDTAETVRRRLEVYHEQTAPLIAYYEAGPTPVHRVDGDRPVPEVLDAILGALEK